MLRQITKYRPVIRAFPERQRQQSTSAVSVSTPMVAPKAKAEEWELARPFREIPKVHLLSFICYMLPGGRYYKMEHPDILLDLHKRLGPLFRLPSIMGKSEYLVCNNPTYFERVMRAEGAMPVRQGKSVLDHHRSQHRKDFYQGIEGLISTEGEPWYKFRSVVNPILMQPKTIRLYYHKLSNISNEFVQRIRDVRSSTTLEVPSNFEHELNRWTLECISLVALDTKLGLLNEKHINPQAKKLLENLSECFMIAAEIELKPSLWRYISTPLYKRGMTVLDNIQDITNHFVTESLVRLENESKGKSENEQSLLEKLLKIDKKIAKVMAMDLMLVGVDTTASVLTSCLLCLSKSPDKQAILREEVLRILPEKDSEFTEVSMKNAPYLRACIKESLRIFPLLPANSRITQSDIVLNGHQIPRETAVIMLWHGMQHDERYYARSLEFLPERWLRQLGEQNCPNPLKAAHPFVYVPFGYGPRICAGKRIAEMEIELGIARIVRNFHIEYNYPTENAFKSSLINVPNIPLKFKFSDVDN